MEAILDSFAAKFPQICAPKTSIGKSIEGRDLWMVKISDNVAQKENEPEVYYDAVHHAREPLSMTTTLLFMDRLLEGYGSDPELTFIVDERELYFVPCVNPDGYVYNQTTNPGGGGMWRKNRRDNGGGVFGVDLNRNYTTGWNAPNGGNSTNPSSSIYRGTAPFSEPESVAIEAFMSGHSFTLTNSVHTYTEILLRPWGYLSGGPANGAEYDQVGAVLTAGNGVAHGPVSTLLYIASGTAVDHHHQAHGALAWTPELGRSGEGGFWPAPPKQVEIANWHQHMFQAMALASGPMLDIGDVSVTEAPGGNGNGVVEPGESGLVVVDVANRGLVAAQGAATLQLAALSSGITITNGQASVPSPGRLSTNNNAGNPLSFAVPSGYGAPLADFRVTMQGGGRTVARDFRVLFAVLRTAVDDDMEQDRGFARVAGGTATTGRWERAAPQQTMSSGQIFQPGFQHTPQGQLCWVTDARAGSSAGTFDVDGGYTDLVSPVLDLTHMLLAELRFWRWYAESTNDDAFEVYVSDDAGQSWTRVLQDSGSTGGWVELAEELASPLTDKMQFRVRAQDQNASLVEALIDDFEIRGIQSDASITLLSSGAIGTRARVGMNGAPGASGYLLAGLRLGTPLTVPGVAGMLGLDPVLIIDFPPVMFGASGYAAIGLGIPNDPVLRGAKLHLQMFHVAGTALSLGNLQTLSVK